MRLLFGIFLGIFAAGITTIILVEHKWGDCTRSKQEFFLFEYKGKIVRKYHSDNHNNQVTVFENEVEKSSIFDYEVWEKIRPGDILIKRKKELNFILISGEDTTYYKEEIPDCAQFLND